MRLPSPRHLQFLLNLHHQYIVMTRRLPVLSRFCWGVYSLLRTQLLKFHECLLLLWGKVAKLPRERHSGSRIGHCWYFTTA